VTRGFRSAILLLSAFAASIPSAAWASIRVLGEAELVDPKPDPKNPDKPVSPYKNIVVRVKADASGLRIGGFQLKTNDVEPAVTMPAIEMTDFHDSTEPMSLIILVDGKVRFMGDPAPAPVSPDEKPMEVPGGYNEAKQAIEAIAKSRTKNTKVALWVMTEKVLEKSPLDDPAKITGDLLGAQKDYAGVGAAGLKLALEKAQTTLAGQPGRRVVVVIGDGRDLSEQANFDEVAQKFLTAQIEAYFILASPQEIAPPTKNRIERFVTRVGGGVTRADPITQLPQVAGNLASNLNNVYTVTFPGQTEGGTVLPFDGNTHEVTILANREETQTSVNFPLIEKPKPVAAAKSKLWLWLALGGGGLLLVIILLLVVLRRRGDDEEEEVEAPAPELPPLQSPMPSASAPQKTMMLGDGGGQDYPTVGWIVPLAGPSRYQTFKLGGARTVIGTTPDCNVVIADPYMQGQHAEIRLQGEAYFLFDMGSNNGTYVDQKKITSHELIDNDQFTCGQTEFKFKSIK
jgi:Inner membrane component of T3SS, cytoplasmic domain